MASREIIPYGADLSKKPDALTLTAIPLEVIPICSNQSYYTQAVRHPLIAQKLFKVTKEINHLPLKDHEVLTGLKTNKFEDITCAKYRSVTPHTIVDGVQALPD